MIELDNGETKERMISEFESDVNEITLLLNEFNRFSELNIDKSKLLSSFFSKLGSDKLIEFDHVEDASKSELELALDKFSVNYEKFQKAYIFRFAFLNFIY